MPRSCAALQLANESPSPAPAGSAKANVAHANERRPDDSSRLGESLNQTGSRDRADAGSADARLSRPHGSVPKGCPNRHKRLDCPDTFAQTGSDRSGCARFAAGEARGIPSQHAALPLPASFPARVCGMRVESCSLKGAGLKSPSVVTSLPRSHRPGESERPVSACRAEWCRPAHAAESTRLRGRRAEALDPEPTFGKGLVDWDGGSRRPREPGRPTRRRRSGPCSGRGRARRANRGGQDSPSEGGNGGGGAGPRDRNAGEGLMPPFNRAARCSDGDSQTCFGADIGRLHGGSRTGLLIADRVRDSTLAPE